MTDNQQTQIVSMLGDLISEVREIKKTQSEHGVILKEHSAILNEHSSILNEHGVMLKSHDQKLDLLLARTDDIAKIVIVNDKRLTSVEKDVTELRERVH